jgi:excisionase family DNA binding protein
MATELLSPTDAAKRIGVNPRTLKRWAADGKIRHVRLPSGRFRFPADVVDEVLAERIPDGDAA